MRYMTLIYNDPNLLANMSEAEQGEQFNAYMQFNQEAAERGVLREGLQLHPATTATTVRIREGKLTTFDGPFAETKEYLGGIYILECDNLDEAIELAAKIPAAAHGCVEIRPIYEVPQR